jgi:hypothetical protein
MDAGNKLLWDLVWVVPFEIGVASLGTWLMRRPPSSSGGAPRNTRVAHLLLAMAVVIAGTISVQPPAGAPKDRALVVFRPGMGFADIVAASEAVGGRPVWTDRSNGIWLVALEPGAKATKLYWHGALLVSTGPVGVGCLSWTEV